MRKIIHIDMDCFYAAVEMRDDPSLKEVPIAVGGSDETRGVICTCNYIARNYGIHSAMSTAKAYRLCPQLIVLPVNISKYKKIAVGIRKIFFRYTDLVEPISLDEAYLDVTNTTVCSGSATWIANKIRKEINEKFKLTASAGVAPNKMLAKIASDWNKPDGIFVIPPEQVSKFIKTVRVEKINGVGRVTANKLHNMGIYVCADIQKYPLEKLSSELGKFGQRIFEMSFGNDNRTVQTNWDRKSLSIEKTFPIDIASLDEAQNKLKDLCIELLKRSQKHSDRKIHKQFVKIKFDDFSITTVEKISNKISENLIFSLFMEGYNRHKKPMRLLGVGVRFAETNKPFQLQLLDIG